MHGACRHTQGGGRRLLQGTPQNAGVEVAVEVPAANASDVQAMLHQSLKNGTLQIALSKAGNACKLPQNEQDCRR